MKQMTEERALSVGAERLFSMAGQGPVVVTKNGKPSLAVVPLHGQDWESYVVSRSPVFKRAVARARRSYRKYGGVSLEEVKKRYGIR